MRFLKASECSSTHGKGTRKESSRRKSTGRWDLAVNGTGGQKRASPKEISPRIEEEVKKGLVNWLTRRKEVGLRE